MSNQAQNPNAKKYDLEERTAKFGEDIIEFCKSLPKTVVTIPIIKQLIRAATSIGANYMEADAADTKKDFRYKIGLCKKEAKVHWKEAHELVLIFSSILNNSRTNKK